MLTDTRKEVRTLGWRRIQKSRKLKKKSALRIFEVPTSINLEASDYVDLLDWQSVDLTEPPLTKSLSDEDLTDNAKNGKIAGPEISSYPSHTQAVERYIRVVTEASGSVFGAENRDSYVRAKLASRQKIPKFESKQYFH